MPGKLGMRPDQSRRSVPELMPDHSVCTTTSSALAGARSICLSPRFSGFSRTTATVFMVGLHLSLLLLNWAGLSESRLSLYSDTRECQL